MAYVGKLSRKDSFQEILSFFAYLLCISFALLRPTVSFWVGNEAMDEGWEQKLLARFGWNERPPALPAS